MVRFDDVGSLPLPDDVDRGEFSESFADLEEDSLELYRELMELKLDSGLDVPCYPQLRDMNDQYLSVLNDNEVLEEPYLVKKSSAMLPEFEALDRIDLDLPPLKICVTGPLEITVSEFDGIVYEDVMMNIAESLKRFIDSARSFDSFDVEVVSIDEPSLGTNPDLNLDSETLLDAWGIVGEGSDEVQIHLHSPLYYETVCRSENVDIIDIATASTPEYLQDIEPEELEESGKSLRIGVSRTDVLSLASEFNESQDVNVWKDDSNWEAFLEEVERPAVIEERIDKAYQRFGDLIDYMGPDCGLSGSKRLDLARTILENTGEAIDSYF